MAALMELCQKFMLRRTSTVLKKLLPAKVEQVKGRAQACRRGRVLAARLALWLEEQCQAWQFCWQAAAGQRVHDYCVCRSTRA